MSTPHSWADEQADLEIAAPECRIDQPGPTRGHPVELGTRVKRSADIGELGAEVALARGGELAGVDEPHVGRVNEGPGAVAYGS